MYTKHCSAKTALHHGMGYARLGFVQFGSIWFGSEKQQHMLCKNESSSRSTPLASGTYMIHWNQSAQDGTPEQRTKVPKRTYYDDGPSLLNTDAGLLPVRPVAGCYELCSICRPPRAPACSSSRVLGLHMGCSEEATSLQVKGLTSSVTKGALSRALVIASR